MRQTDNELNHQDLHCLPFCTAPDKVVFHPKITDIFSYFSMKTYGVGTH